MSAIESGTDDQARLRALMEQNNLAPLWEVYTQIVTPKPVQDIPSHTSKWTDMVEPIEEAARTVKEEDADHRVLLLKHPSFSGDRITSTTNIIGSVQCVLPGEQTTAHRHTPSAVRLVLEGSGGGTFVDGIRCDMRTGDFIVTPNWTWHNHHNDSNDRVIWVDILDVPFVQHLDAMFGQLGQKNNFEYPDDQSTLPNEVFCKGGLLPVSRRPAPNYSPQFHYAWADVVDLLPEIPIDETGSRSIKYVNPLNGGAIVPTLEARATEIIEGRPTTPMRSTASGICVVLEGSGQSKIGDVTHSWGPRDIFTLSQWSTITHTAETECARLFTVTDREMLSRLGLLREEWNVS